MGSLTHKKLHHNLQREYWDRTMFSLPPWAMFCFSQEKIMHSSSPLFCQENLLHKTTHHNSQSFFYSWNLETLSLVDVTCLNCIDLREPATLKDLSVVPANPCAQLSWRLSCSLLSSLPSPPVDSPLKHDMKVSLFYMVVSISQIVSRLLVVKTFVLSRVVFFTVLGIFFSL